MIDPDIGRANVQWRFITTPTAEARYIASGHAGQLYTAGGYRGVPFDGPQHPSFGLAVSADGVDWKPAMLSNLNYYNDPQFILNSGRTIVVGGWLLRDDNNDAVPNDTDWRDAMSIAVSEDGGATWSMPLIKPRPWWSSLMTLGGAVGNGRFVALGYGAPGMYVIGAATSSPQNWRMSNLSPGVVGVNNYPDGRFPLFVDFLDGVFVLHVAENAPVTPLGASVSRLYLSTDGLAWTERHVWPEGWGGRCIASDGSKWISIAVGGEVWVSYTRGQSWAATGSFLGGSDPRPYPWKVAWKNGIWVAGVEASKPWQPTPISLYWSADGVTWAPAIDPFMISTLNESGAHIWDLYHDGTQWWAAGIGWYGYNDTGIGPSTHTHVFCTLANSTDGKTWKKVDMTEAGGVRVLTGIRKIPAP